MSGFHSFQSQFPGSYLTECKEKADKDSTLMYLLMNDKDRGKSKMKNNDGDLFPGGNPFWQFPLQVYLASSNLNLYKLAQKSSQNLSHTFSHSLRGCCAEALCDPLSVFFTVDPPK